MTHQFQNNLSNILLVMEVIHKQQKMSQSGKAHLGYVIKNRKLLKPIFRVLELELGFLQSRPLEIFFLMVPPIPKLVALTLQYFSYDLKNRFQIFIRLPITQTLKIIKKDYKVKSQLKSSNFFPSPLHFRSIRGSTNLDSTIQFQTSHR